MKSSLGITCALILAAAPLHAQALRWGERGNTENAERGATVFGEGPEDVSTFSAPLQWGEDSRLRWGAGGAEVFGEAAPEPQAPPPAVGYVAPADAPGAFVAPPETAYLPHSEGAVTYEPVAPVDVPEQGWIEVPTTPEEAQRLRLRGYQGRGVPPASADRQQRVVRDPPPQGFAGSPDVPDRFDPPRLVIREGQDPWAPGTDYWDDGIVLYVPDTGVAAGGARHQPRKR
jgi:hypothetical protein